MSKVLLHGTLHVTIYEVDKLHGEGGGPNIFGKVYHRSFALVMRLFIRFINVARYFLLSLKEHTMVNLI